MMLYSGTDPESYITEYTLVYEDKPEAKSDDHASLRVHRPPGFPLSQNVGSQ